MVLILFHLFLSTRSWDHTFNDKFGVDRKDQIQTIINTHIELSQAMAMIFNTEKNWGPDVSLVILGLLFCSVILHISYHKI